MVCVATLKTQLYVGVPKFNISSFFLCFVIFRTTTLFRHSNADFFVTFFCTDVDNPSGGDGLFCCMGFGSWGWTRSNDGWSIGPKMYGFKYQTLLSVCSLYRYTCVTKKWTRKLCVNSVKSLQFVFNFEGYVFTRYNFYIEWKFLREFCFKFHSADNCEKMLQIGWDLTELSSIFSDTVYSSDLTFQSSMCLSNAAVFLLLSDFGQMIDCEVSKSKRNNTYIAPQTATVAAAPLYITDRVGIQPIGRRLLG